MATELDVGGYSVNKTIEGQAVSAHTSTLRLRSTDKLDVIVTGDGTKTVFKLLQDAAAALASAAPPMEPPAEWTELLRVPANNMPVTVSLGVRSDYKENV
jgi:hypothetical protein